MKKISFVDFVNLFPSVYKFDHKKKDLSHYGGERDYPCPSDAYLHLEKSGLVYCKTQEIGGAGGGTCWEDSDPQPYHCTNEFEFNIDFIFTEKNIDISFSKYLKIKKLFKNKEYTDREYYGNYTDYKIYYIYLDELYEEIFGDIDE